MGLTYDIVLLGDNMKVGDKIKKIRKEKGLTQKELARRSGIAVITLQQYEQNRRTPGVKPLNAIAISLDCPVSALMDDEWTDILEKIVADPQLEPEQAQDIKAAFQGAILDTERIQEQGKPFRDIMRSVDNYIFEQLITEYPDIIDNIQDTEIADIMELVYRYLSPQNKYIVLQYAYSLYNYQGKENIIDSQQQEIELLKKKLKELRTEKEGG